MNPNLPSPEPIEIERYELRTAPLYQWGISRREFFKRTGGGLFLFLLVSEALGQESGGRRRRRRFRSRPQQISAWIHLPEGGSITVYTGKVEVGQNIRTSLSQAVAEELRIPVSTITLIMGDTQRTPFDFGTFGSRTTPDMAPQLHRAAAALRQWLVDLAARKWSVGPDSLVVKDGAVIDPQSHRTLSFGQLAKGQQLAKALIGDPRTTSARQWRIAGTSVPKVDGRDFVTGRHQYPSDIQRPGMLVGRVLRPPSFGARLLSCDASKADSLPGVHVVQEEGFAGVVAPNEFVATQAIRALRAKWTHPPEPAGDTLWRQLRQPEGRSARDHERILHEAGSVPKGLKKAAHSLRHTYTLVYIAHAPLEPRAAVAEWNGDQLTVWTGTQRPFGVRGELAQAFHLPESSVRVLMPDMGSGYGGKHTGEAAVEAARLARGAGKPVKLIWTRSEEFTWAYFRPAGIIEIAAGVLPDGTLTAWECRNYNSGASAIRPPYAIPNQRIVFHPSDAPLRQGSYRALAATGNHFARESLVDELAHEVGQDPLAFRLKNLTDERLRTVLEKAASAFGWKGRHIEKGRGYGLACGVEKGGYVATCAEVSVAGPGAPIKVERVVCAFDCGAVVNPNHLRNQIEGANIMGLGGALFEAIEFDKGRILNPHFYSYRVPRFQDIPKIEAVLVDRPDQPSAGAGETPIVGLAPAIANALFAASGVRIRSMPLMPAWKQASKN